MPSFPSSHCPTPCQAKSSGPCSPGSPPGLRKGFPGPRALSLSSSHHSGGAAGPVLTPLSHAVRCEGQALPLLPLVPVARLASAILAVCPEPSDVHRVRCLPSASGGPSSWGWWGSQKTPRVRSGGWAHLTLRASTPAPTSMLWAVPPHQCYGQTSTALQTSSPQAGVTPRVREEGSGGQERPTLPGEPPTGLRGHQASVASSKAFQRGL